MKFHVGDVVIGNPLANAHYVITREGWTGIVKKILSGDRIVVYGSGIGGSADFDVSSNCFDLLTKGFDPMEKKGDSMTKLTAMFKRLTDKDTQTLRKAGFINGDLELTGDGQQALNAVLFEANKPALVELAKEMLEEEKEK